MPRTGRPPAIAAEQYPMLVKLAQAHPFSSQAELADAFHAETGITAHPDTFAKALKLAGITRIKQRTKGSFVSSEPRKSYGYNETHRRQLPEQRYPSCLTDAEWALVAVLFETQGGRGVPPRHSQTDAARGLLLCSTHWVLMAHAASRVSSLGQCLQNLPPVEYAGQI
jgi:hypothetical protein